MLIDLHVHSHHTRGVTLAPRDVVRRAKEAGLDGVAFTDLNTLDGLDEFRAAGRDEQFLVLCGVEVATDRGHYLCFFPDPAKVPAPPQIFGSATPWPVREVLAKVRELGGVAVAAHPYDKTVERPSGDVIFTLEGLAAIEGLNARRKGPANDLAIEAADHMSLPCTGGSGAHELPDIGKAATLFRDPVASEADLVAQLRAGTVFCVAIGVTPQPTERGGRDGERRDRPPRREERGERGGDRGGERSRGGRGGHGRGGGRGGHRR
ncbi:PHP-associated domain-containing protein [Anaeromyxobacter oryzae]|uniref:Histidinol-phosphatase n=1 Tax=Anaeromyxobacter oryzae TaxID=2918170 RepID=A0ABM7WQK5_9BACT|nr:PHP domain-containing protein [Anaeromyxobacter oryzae]BDG01744.1 histidinol-phosphatase [Anaeromyxobacter oryzae]